MGNSAASANKQKKSQNGYGRNIIFACSSIQGWRNSMEDAHIFEVELTEDISIFGVFDGHGGKEVALFVEKYFIEELKKNTNYKNLKFQEALHETFLKMDELIRSEDGQKELNAIRGDQNQDSSSGCTANVALIYKDTIYVANAGDSRSVLCRQKKPFDMSKDHKPDDPLEKERIEKAGGCVANGRINMSLNLSRSLGDLDYKSNEQLREDQQLVTAVPEFQIEKLTSDDQYLLMGCDGIFDTWNHEQLLSYINECIGEQYPTPEVLQLTVESLLDQLVAKDTSVGTGCDNMTAIIVYFLNEAEMKQWKQFKEQKLPNQDVKLNFTQSKDFIGTSFQLQGWNSFLDGTIICENLGEELDLFGIFKGGGHQLISLNFKELLKENFQQNNFPLAFVQIFQQLDNILSQQRQIMIRQRCTAIIALKHRKTIYVANLGDCQAFLNNDDHPKQIGQMHRYSNQSEQDRLINEGVQVKNINLFEILDEIDVSRSFGCFEYKEQKLVSIVPDVQQFDITNEDQYLLLGSRGIFDELSQEVIIEYLKDQLGEFSGDQDMLEKASSNLILRCLRDDKSGSKYNSLAQCDLHGIIIQFIHKQNE